MADFIGLLFLGVVIVAYFFVMWGVAQLLVHGNDEQQLALIERRLPVVRAVYWLLTAPLLCAAWLWVFSSRWSFSTALLPAALVLLLLSGIAAGVYWRMAPLRLPLLVQAVILGVSSLGIIQSLMTKHGGLAGERDTSICYQKYPFTVKLVEQDYTDVDWVTDMLNGTSVTYYSWALYQTIWGFDYLVGHLNLGSPQQPPTVKVGTFWPRVRSFHFAPDSARGRLRLSPLPEAGKYNAFTDRIELPREQEQVVDFWIDTSLEPQPRPKEN
jgi:hypothetical protein